MKRKHSLILIWGLLIILLVMRFTASFKNTLSWDVKGYYLYLPALFIYDDLSISHIDWVKDIQEKYQTTSTLYMLNRTESGDHVIKYTSGLAILYAPFFLVGHVIASLHSDFPADGFSLPYQYALSLGVFLYVFLGLWFLRRILHHFFDDRTTFFTLFLLIAGTNLVNQFGFQTLLAHTPLFVLNTILIWCIIRFYDNLNKGDRSINYLKYFVFAGLLCGLITLIRPTEIVCVFLAGLWGVDSFPALKNRVLLFLKNPLWILLFGGMAMSIILPQMAYWKSLTGDWIHYSYDNPGEGLDFLSPHSIPFLFSFRKGWLVYTPVMFLIVPGFILLYKKQRSLFFPLGLFFMVSLYLMSSWTNWWYAGGCFSSRTILSLYPALAIPFGLSVGFMIDRFGRFLKAFAYLLAVFLIILNLFHTWQFQQGIISRESMTKAYYFRTFFKTSVTDADKQLLMVTRPLTAIEFFADEQFYTESTLFKDLYQPADYPELRFTDELSLNGSHSMILDSITAFSPVRTFAFHEITGTDHAWLRGKAMVYIPENYQEADPLLVMSFLHNGEHYKYRSSEGRPINIIPGQWNEIGIDYVTPEVRSTSDVFQVYLWHRGKQPIYLDHIEVSVFVR